MFRTLQNTLISASRKRQVPYLIREVVISISLPVSPNRNVASIRPNNQFTRHSRHTQRNNINRHVGRYSPNHASNINFKSLICLDFPMRRIPQSHHPIRVRRKHHTANIETTEMSTSRCPPNKNVPRHTRFIATDNGRPFRMRYKRDGELGYGWGNEG